MADTLVVPAAAGWSAIASAFDVIPSDPKNNKTSSNRFGTDVDAYLSVVLWGVAVFACFKIAQPFLWSREEVNIVRKPAIHTR
jgi:hypothetical protein